MTERPAPAIHLKKGGNPWSEMLSDGLVQRLLLDAALKCEEEIDKWIQARRIEPEFGFTQVFLDPTNPRDQLTTFDRIFAVILYGDQVEAVRCLPAAAAIADAEDRHPGRSSAEPERVFSNIFSVGNGELSYGHAVTYEQAVAAGNGLPLWLDRDLTKLTLVAAMDSIHNARIEWLEERSQMDTHEWLSQGNVPGPQYQFGLDPASWLSLSTS